MRFLFVLLSAITVYSFLTIGSVKLLIAEQLINPNGSSIGDTVKVIEPELHYAIENQLILTLLSRYHYKKFDLNDSLSNVIFDRYLNSLDNGKNYFLREDIIEFESSKNKIDDYLTNGDLKFFYEVFEKYLTRLNERENFIENSLQNEFDLNTDEVFYFKRDSVDWASSEEELNDLWLKRLKNDAISYKLNDKDWEFIKTTLVKRYKNFAKFMNQYTSEDVFQLAMNSLSVSIDPHTNYLSPATSDNFKIDMSLSLEGIGSRLQTEDDYTKVFEIVPGGPAAKSKLLFADDKIIAVAQGEDGEFEDVIGWRITEVVKLIRGPKGTTVRLQILPAKEGVSGKSKEIVLVRDKIKLEDQSAKSEILEIDGDSKAYKIGVIKIPSFYIDIDAQRNGDKNYKSTTSDVKKIIEDLDKENVDGIVVDLRNNGGGSLSEAIDLTGLFIEYGPIVQVKNSNGSIDSGVDSDAGISFDGPLAVLVNRFSASASEIFSAAIQDYNRGIVLGENTFGKGTVQNLIDLNRLTSNNNNELGQLKLTIAKYYRIDGGSTQNLGVQPDISFPSYFEAEEFGESSEPNALPWDQIKSTRYKLFSESKPNFDLINEKHLQRIKSDIEFQNLLAEIEDYRATRDKKFVSLNLDERIKEKEETEAKKFDRENRFRKVKGLKLLEKSEVKEEVKNESDYILKETANILGDYISFIES